MREYTYYELAIGSWISNDGTLVSMDYSDVFGNRSRVCVCGSCVWQLDPINAKGFAEALVVYGGLRLARI